MIPASRREIAGQRTAANLDIVVEADLPDDPWRVVDAKRQAVIVAKLRVAVSRPRRIAVEDRAEDGDLVRERGLDANAGHRDRRRRTAGRQVGGLDGRPAERAVDEQIVGLAVEELDVGRLLADPDVQRVVVKALLEIGVVEPRVGQRLDLADGRQIVDVVARQPAAVDLVGVGEESAAGPADQLFEVGIDREIEAAEMDGAARGSARDVADVVADIGRTEIQALGGKPVMPFVEPFRREPFGGAFVLGAGVRAGARRSAPARYAAATDQSAQRKHSRWSRLTTKPTT